MLFKNISTILIVLLSILLISCSDDSESSDCDEFIPPEKVSSFGESCDVFTYGNCPTEFSTCLDGEGECISSVCTTRCETSLNCPSGYFCAVNGTCLPPAVCNDFNDGATFCTYTNDPDDPTECIQVSCKVL